MNKQKQNHLFKAFLIVYIGFLVFHSMSLDWHSWRSPAGILLGLGIAALAHSRYCALTIGLLLVHMSLEWFEYAQHGSHFSSGEIALHGVHSLLDFVFLYRELQVHMKRFHNHLFAGITASIAMLFIFNYKPATKSRFAIMMQEHSQHEHHHGDDPFEPVIMGGMFGCIIYHLKIRRRRSA